MTKWIGLSTCCVVILGVLVPSPVSAQCSGSCLLNPQTSQYHCSLSLFGQVICWEGPDWCAEFACPDGLAAARAFRDPHPGQCQQAAVPSFPGGQVEPTLPLPTIKVVALKSRT
jgi:hypothetical protein